MSVTARQLVYEKILCPVDPYKEAETSLRHLAKMVEPILPSATGNFAVVYVLSSGESLVPLTYFQKWATSFQQDTEKALREKIAKVGFPGDPEAIVLLENPPLTRLPAELLAEYAKGNGFDLIAVHTHARTGIARFVLGSFAESLLACSSVPLLMTNPAHEAVESYEQLFFPTSLSDKSRLGLEAATRFASTVGAHLTIYHRWSAPPAWTKRYYDGYTEYKSGTLKALKATGEEWAKWAESQGVSVDLRFDEGEGEVSAEAIMSVARDLKASAIALFPEAAPNVRAVFGNVTREVIRTGEVPVLAQRLR